MLPTEYQCQKYEIVSQVRSLFLSFALPTCTNILANIRCFYAKKEKRINHIAYKNACCFHRYNTPLLRTTLIEMGFRLNAYLKITWNAHLLSLENGLLYDKASITHFSRCFFSHACDKYSIYFSVDMKCFQSKVSFFFSQQTQTPNSMNCFNTIVYTLWLNSHVYFLNLVSQWMMFHDIVRKIFR